MRALGRIGRPGSVEDAEREEEARRIEEVRQARVQAARGNERWIEIPQERLGRRGPWLVDAESDKLYSFFRGVIWDRGRILFNEQIPMTYYVDRDTAEVVVLEESRSPATWSEVVRRRAGAAA